MRWNYNNYGEEATNMVKAGIIGATGYAGVELIRLLAGHGKAKLHKIASVSFTGKSISEIYPSYYGMVDDILCPVEEVIETCDVIFAAVPHGVSQPIAAQCAENGKAFIDIGADFRLESEEAYETWYGGTFENKELHKKAVYGLPEFNREDIRKTKIVANPGCYPTSIALGLYPALKNDLVNKQGIIIDSKSGSTGAGRGLSQGTHFVDLNEGFHPYKIGAHRHTPEIEQTLSKMAGETMHVTFVPHLLPVNRGIVSTIYCKKATSQSLADIHQLYCEFYKEETFVKVLPLGQFSDIRGVRLSNNCHISIHEDAHTGMLIVVSAIDNMVKGAAGQAIQNMNILFDFAEAQGLDTIPPAI